MFLTLLLGILTCKYVHMNGQLSCNKFFIIILNMIHVNEWID